MQLKPEKLFGFQQTLYHDVSLKGSDCEKTMLDCLERFDLCGGVAEVARTISALIGETDPATLLDYLPRMDNQALEQRLGLILERLSTVQEIEGDLIAGILPGKWVSTSIPWIRTSRRLAYWMAAGASARKWTSWENSSGRSQLASSAIGPTKGASRI